MRDMPAGDSEGSSVSLGGLDRSTLEESAISACAISALPPESTTTNT